jgi:Amt family ammonium transporter
MNVLKVVWLGLAMTVGLTFVSQYSSIMAQEAPAVTGENKEAAPAATSSTPTVGEEKKPEEPAPAEAPAEAPKGPETQSPINTGHTAWMLVSSLLVLMMTIPGLALFYGGLVRKKNVLSIMMQCLFLSGILSIIWFLYGYSLCFSPHLEGSQGFVGGFSNVMFQGVVPYLSAEKAIIYPVWGTYEIPTLVFAMFQMTFFIITPALIIGAYAERMKFSAMVVFSILWATLIYCPIAHWVWSDWGWLCEWNKDAKYKAIDFAGGTVVHISSGYSALICCLMLGKRLGYNQEPMFPHNLTYTFIGTALLWVGWFGFNAGSALGASFQAANAFVVTHMATCGGVVGWSLCEWIARGKPSVLGACSGAVAGLVCVTPASGSCPIYGGIIIGLAAGVVSFIACTGVKKTFGYDDTLDVFGVHGVSGTLGALLTGVFASTAIRAGEAGVLEGNSGQMLNQVVSIAASAGYAMVGTAILLKLIDLTIGLRVSQNDEIQGLDLSQHGEEGYIQW